MLKETKARTAKVLLWLGIALIAAAAFYFLFWGSPWEAKHKQTQFKSYLKERYQQDFEIKKLDFDFMHRTYHAYAYPLLEPNLRFHVGQEIDSQALSDAYPRELWKYQATQALKPLIMQQFPEATSIFIEIQNVNELTEDQLTQLPSFKHAASVRIGVTLEDISITESNEPDQLERVLQLLDTLQAEGSNLDNIGFTYTNEVLHLNKQQIAESLEDHDVDSSLLKEREQ
ncbi:hypothetical protein [Paenibacillus donghaensis]|uniref:Uncharacterized protein n=1 Tax=Paenibacillus donghaensis TaxID=414771 RepID=A0A2Z2KM53_9BACL|nr:hypothetical protein [Paenibacillus donghaensis]ASA21121.1 hypothetical protein B9T62_10180 [Paenibacillus donghaensis]